MSFDIVCHGCGAGVTIPDDHARNKMQCPECGVMCPVPARPAAKKKVEEKKPAEDAAHFEDDAPAAPVRTAPPPPVTTFVKEPIPADNGLAMCPHCGEMVRPPKRKRGKQSKCPICAADWPAPAPRPKPPPPPPLPVPPLPDEFAGSTPDQNPETSNPYRTADPASRRCPGCSARLSHEVVVCVRCGFDLRTGRKVVKEYDKFERSWDSGMSLKTRVRWFLLCQIYPVLCIAAIFYTLDTLENSWAVAVATCVFSWLVYTALTAFLLGTFDHCQLKRYKSGKVDLVRMWRLGFIPWPQVKIDLRDYSTAVSGVTYINWWEWLIFFFLFGTMVPAAIYWYCVIHKTEYTVALAKDHEVPEIYVYRGWSQEEMLQIKQSLRDAMTL